MLIYLCCPLHYVFLLFSDNYRFIIQVVIVPIWKKEEEKAGVLNAAFTAFEFLKGAGIRVKVDDTEQRTPGWKFNFWEMKVSAHCYSFCYDM